MNTIIFDTEAEANTQQEIDYILWIDSHSGGNYIEGTTSWATPRLRLDGKYDYPCCPGQDYSGMTTAVFSADNYESSEDL